MPIHSFGRKFERKTRAIHTQQEHRFPEIEWYHNQYDTTFTQFHKQRSQRKYSRAKASWISHDSLHVKDYFITTIFWAHLLILWWCCQRQMQPSLVVASSFAPLNTNTLMYYLRIKNKTKSIYALHFRPYKAVCPKSLGHCTKWIATQLRPVPYAKPSSPMI